MRGLKSEFLLDPGIHFLNHGSFGACPRRVFASYRRWQLRLERQPVLFLDREHEGLLRRARAALGAYLNADPDDLAFVPNATHGVNLAAACLDLGPGDEVLATDHEYGACDFAWQDLCGRRGAVYLRRPIGPPSRSRAELAETLWAGVTPRTRAIFLSHISSPTALRLPVEEICRRARASGIATVIDGAHAPGQVPLNLTDLGADFYTGNCHKWMMAPKGSAFLHVRRELQDRVRALVVSWGYRKPPGTGTGSRFLDLLQWSGTYDPAAYLAVPDAIRFQARHGWDTVRSECHELLRRTLERIADLSGLEPAYPPDSGAFVQMAVAPLPESLDLPEAKARLYDEFKVEVPLIPWGDRKYVRVSVQGYNTEADIEALLAGLGAVMRDTRGGGSSRAPGPGALRS